MKVDFNAALTHYDGRLLREGDQTITLRLVACNSLSQARGSISDMQDAWDLAKRIHESNGECEMSVAEVNTVQRSIQQNYPAAVAVPATALLEPSDD